MKRFMYLGSFLLSLILVYCQSKGDSPITLYSGRSQSLIQPLIDQFIRDSGIRVKVRYGKTSELSLLLLEEGKKSPADLFLAQDAGGIGLVAKAGLFERLSQKTLAKVDGAFCDHEARWVGISGRSRVLAYSTDRLKEQDLPQSLEALSEPRWEGRLGWAPMNGSFQAFVTAMRVRRGEAATESWLYRLKANGAKTYPKNTPIIQAIAGGEIDVGLVNHYYLHRFIAREGSDFPVANFYMEGNTEATLMNVSGIALLKPSKNKKNSLKLVDYLLSDKAQRYFHKETHEYPLALAYQEEMKKLSHPGRLPTQTKDMKLSDLADLKATIALLRKTGLLN